MNNHYIHVNEWTKETKPRAILVLLGWWGAKRRHLAKYAEIYNADCQTVLVICDSVAFLGMGRFDKFIDSCARQTMRTVVTLLKREERFADLPVVTHAFSNGGAYVVYLMEQYIRRAESYKLGSSDREWMLLSNHWRAQLLDSAPAWPGLETSVAAAKGIFRNPLLRLVVTITIHLVTLIEDILLRGLLRRSDWRTDYTDAVSASLVDYQAYIYSPADEVTDFRSLEKVIQSSQSKVVATKRFEDSNHVEHMRKHPEAYRQFCCDFLTQVLGKA